MLVDQATRCAVVGGGPGGVMLAYLLARAGVPVTLLEARPDFDRRFRGDALAPSVLELLDVLGLADPLLAAVPHGTADGFVWRTPTRAYRLADYRRASTTYPYRRSSNRDACSKATALLRDGDERVTGAPTGATPRSARSPRSPRRSWARTSTSAGTRCPGGTTTRPSPGWS